jgi:3-methyl-2-oxobutanoate hydroxymethyltransferase
MSVMGHLGLTPQRIAALGGFKVQGRTASTAIELLDDALALQTAGIFSLALEAVPPEPARAIQTRLRIPVGTLGSGPNGDMFMMLSPDLLGLIEDFTPKFVKRYNNFAEQMRKSFREYIDDVRTGRHPTSEFAYQMLEGEAEKLNDLLDKRRDYK